MNCRVLCVKGYNYPNKKTGELKIGISLDITTPDPVCRNDGNGNFIVGSPTENIRIPGDFMMATDDIIDLEGHVVDLVYDRLPGQKFERLSRIDIIE